MSLVGIFQSLLRSSQFHLVPTVLAISSLHNGKYNKLLQRHCSATIRCEPGTTTHSRLCGWLSANSPSNRDLLGLGRPLVLDRIQGLLPPVPHPHIRRGSETQQSPNTDDLAECSLATAHHNSSRSISDGRARSVWKRRILSSPLGAEASILARSCPQNPRHCGYRCSDTGWQRRRSLTWRCIFPQRCFGEHSDMELANRGNRVLQRPFHDVGNVRRLAALLVSGPNRSVRRGRFLGRFLAVFCSPNTASELLALQFVHELFPCLNLKSAQHSWWKPQRISTPSTTEYAVAFSLASPFFHSSQTIHEIMNLTIPFPLTGLRPPRLRRLLCLPHRSLRLRHNRHNRLARHRTAHDPPSDVVRHAQHHEKPGWPLRVPAALGPLSMAGGAGHRVPRCASPELGHQGECSFLASVEGHEEKKV